MELDRYCTNKSINMTTEEQIEQKAKDYADKTYPNGVQVMRNMIAEVYTAGYQQAVKDLTRDPEEEKYLTRNGIWS